MRSPGYRIVVVSVVVVALIAGGVTIAVAGSGSTTAPITKAQAAARSAARLAPIALRRGPRRWACQLSRVGG